MERRLGNDQTMMLNPFTLIGPGSRLLVAALTALVATAPASAQYYGERTVRYGNTSGPFFDGRDDSRDFPTDGVFPGNFAANPFTRRTAEPLDSWAAILAAPRRHILPRSTSTSRAIGSIVEDIVSVPHRNIRIAGTGLNARDGLTPRKAPGTAASTASRSVRPSMTGRPG